MPLLSTTGASSAKGFGFAGGSKPISVQYLVIAGGGGGGSWAGGGSGAGGYRLNVPGETSGGNSPAEAALELKAGIPFTITIGGGGAGTNGGPYPGVKPGDGSDSVLNTITSLGGGYGASDFGGSPVPAKTPSPSDAQPGGSGGGGLDPSTNYGQGTPGQGFEGGVTFATAPGYGSGGGGGAGAAGTPSAPGVGPGGAGLYSSITGSSIGRAGGGGGGNRPGAGSATASEGGGAGGSGGPGSGGAGGANTGGGAGSAGYTPGPSANAGVSGGSGLVVIKVPLANSATFSPGITQTPTSTPTSNIYQVTAGTGTVTFS